MSKLLPLLLTAALCTGCAYNNAINRGDQQFTGGNYERAVAAYRQALITKPDATKAQQKLAIAQQQLDIWSDQIAVAATNADNRKLTALAAALHQKQAQLNGDSQAAAHAAQLRRQLSIRYTPQVYIEGDPSLLNNFASPAQPFHPGKDNHIQLQVSASEPEFYTEEFDVTGSHQYISGTITRSNPHYLGLQGELQTLHHKLEQLQDNAHYLHQGIDRKQRQLANLKGALQEQRRILEATTPNTPEQQAAEQRIKELKQSIRHSKEKLAAKRTAYSDALHHIEECEQEYHHLEESLAHTPPEIIEDVYATYEYPMVEVVQSTTLTLTFRENGKQYSTEVSHSYSDQVYDGNPRTGLAGDPREPESRAQLHQALLENAAERVAQEAALVTDNYRQQLLDQALQQPDQQGKLDKLIRYTLSNDQPPEPEIRQLTNRLLRAEFGSGGTLDINELLKF